MGALAIVDASVFYGAQRIIAGVHDDPSWTFRGRFRQDDDRELFLQFIHFAVLYERLLLDNSSLASAESTSFGEDSTEREESLARFLADVNAKFEVYGSALVEKGSFGFSRGGHSKSFELGLDFGDLYAAVSRLVAEAVSDPACAARLQALDVPWAYKEAWHSDRVDFEKAAQSVGLDPKWIPQAIFAWRGLWYTELASLVSAERRVSVAYAAAPRRIAVLRELLRDGGRVAALEGRDAAIAAIRKQLPELPVAFDFSDIRNISPYRSSPIGQVAAMRNPNAALHAIAEIRHNRPDLRDWWQTQIFRSAQRDAPVVGIERDLPPSVFASGLTAGGDIIIIVGYPQFEGGSRSMAKEPTRQPSSNIIIEGANAGKHIKASAEGSDTAKIRLKDVDADGSIIATHESPKEKLWLFHWGRAQGKTAVIGLIVVVVLAIIAAVWMRYYA